jgi:hypothetical protein
MEMWVKWCFRKNTGYHHEEEVRAVIWDQQIIDRNRFDAHQAALSRNEEPLSGPYAYRLRKEDGQLGIDVPFAAQRFITEVVVGPHERSWVAALVDCVLRRYGLEIKTTISDLLRSR